jgi:hypothetical protein
MLSLMDMTEGGLLHSLTGSEPAYNISKSVAKRAFRDWVCREHRECWQSIPEQRHPKSFLLKLSAKWTQQIPGKTSNRPVNGKLSPLQTGYN